MPEREFIPEVEAGIEIMLERVMEMRRAQFPGMVTDIQIEEIVRMVYSGAWENGAEHAYDQSASPCIHEHISWHGSRGECQDCGKNVAVPIIEL